MKKLKSMLRQCMKFYQTYEKQIKIAVIAIVVITALLLFGGKGENEEIIVEQEGEMQTELTVEHENVSEGDTGQSAQTTAVKLVVDISGCVKSPGVYEIADGTRLHQVIEMAGGLTKNADIDVINQAEMVTDGQKILIPAKAEAVDFGNGVSVTTAADGKININYADSAALQEIPGVGPATADKIIAYRESNGRFQSIQDLKNVSGIGDKTFEKMKDKICVN